MAAVGLLYVGAVLFVNGMALMGYVKGKSMIPMNLFVGILQIITPLYIIFTADGDRETIVGASGLFLFSFTYLYVAMNNAFNLDGTGLGWFCFFVFLAACVYSYWNFEYSTAVGNMLGVLWANWAFLWLLFWLVLGIGMTAMTQFTGAVCAAQGIYTGFIPALILLNIPSAESTTTAVVIAVVAIITNVIFYRIFKPGWGIGDTAPPPAYSGA